MHRHRLATGGRERDGEGGRGGRGRATGARHDRELKLHRLERIDLGRIHRLPIVGQDAAGVARVRIPRPIGPADPLLARLQVVRAIAVQIPLQIVDHLGIPGPIARRRQSAPEFPEQNGRGARAREIAPIFVPHGRQVVGIARVAEIGLREDARRIVVGGVDKPAGRVQPHRRRPGVGEVATPPVTSRRGPLDALHDHQQAGVGGKHGVACPLGGQPPVIDTAVAPGGGAVRLVVEIDANNRRVAHISRCQHREVADPRALRISGRVPEAGGVGTVARIGAVVIQEDLEPNLPGIGHDRIHDLQAALPLQIGVLREVDAVGCASGVEELVAVGQADRVEAERLHLVHHLPVAT